jgi:hypothetical protein
MEELKTKYNELLARFKKGNELLKEHPEYAEKLSEIQGEMDKILLEIKDYSAEEIENGFKIEEKQITNVKIDNVNKKPIPISVQVQQQTALESFSDNWKIATQLAKSTIIPDNYRGKPENVIIALGLSQKMGIDCFTTMQNLSVIKGKTSWSGSFCKSLIEMTGKFKDLNLNYIGEKGKDSYGCYLSATRISDGKVIKGPEVTMGMAKAEGWTSNKKWTTLTELMLAYRCQSFFARVYCPEALNGIYTDDEIFEMNSNNKKRTIEDVL